MKFLKNSLLALFVTAVLISTTQAQTKQQIIDNKVSQVKINTERIESKLTLAEVSSKEEIDGILLEVKSLRDKNNLLLEEIRKLKQELLTTSGDANLTTQQNISPIKTSPPLVTNPVIQNSKTAKASNKNPPIRSLDDATPQSPPVGAQNESCFWVLNESNPTSKYSRDRINLCDISRTIAESGVNEISINTDTNALGILFAAEIARKFGVSAELDKKRDLKTFIVGAEQVRTDKQVGAGPSSNGTTSLAVKGGGPSIIGWAVENGAATSTVSGTTATIRVNPFGLAQAVADSGYIESGAQITKDSFAKFLKKTSLGFSFDGTRGTETPTFIVSKQQLSALSFRYEFVNDRDPRNPKYLKTWDDFYDTNLNLLQSASVNLENLRDTSSNKGAFKNPTLQKWLNETNIELQKVDRSKFTEEWLLVDAFAGVLNQRIGNIPLEDIKNDPATYNSLIGFLGNYRDFVTAKESILKNIRKGKVVTFEYTNYREPIAPDTSNFRFIWEKGILGKTDITFNASLTMYNKKPTVANVNRLRDFQFALQTETPLKNIFGTGEPTLSFAGRYERVNTDVVNPLGIVTPNSKGDVAIGQIKFTIPIANWGIKLPLSMTFANRSEFIKESTVRGNFGITFDLDPLFAKAKPF